MHKILLATIYGHMFSTAIALLVIILSYVVVNLLAIRKLEGSRKKRRFRIRSFYIACFVFIFLMARIWVEGFTHLLAVLGLVSAALVVTNKETIMNFVGWLIINWRGLFVEDDLIQIQQYRGYVKSFGLLYFSLAEASDGISGNVTGRVIRIPNGLVANNALINLSQTSYFLEQKFSIIITRDSNIEQAIEFVKNIMNQVISEFYQNEKEFSLECLKKRSKWLADHIYLEPRISILPKLDKPAGVELTTYYYCFSRDVEPIQQEIWLTLLHSIGNEKEVELAYNI